jgi:hypothetical protein
LTLENFMLAETITVEHLVSVVKKSLRAACANHQGIGDPNDLFHDRAVEYAVSTVLNGCGAGYNDIEGLAAMAHEGFRQAVHATHSQVAHPPSRVSVASRPYARLTLAERLWPRTVAGAVLSIGGLS